jgi:hypothetical protein
VNANSFSVAQRTEPVASFAGVVLGGGVGGFPPWPWMPGETTDGPAMVKRCYLRNGSDSTSFISRNSCVYQQESKIRQHRDCDYGVKKKPITTCNPQANAIVERVHQTIGNIVRTFKLQDNYPDEDDPWKGILSATAFAISATYHTTLQKSPGQMVFGRDMIFNVKHTAN